jgi:hypothetical protein
VLVWIDAAGTVLHGFDDVARLVHDVSASTKPATRSSRC